MNAALQGVDYQPIPICKDLQLKKMNGNRGLEHFIYMNRTFFGMYSLLHDLKSTETKIQNYTPSHFKVN